LHNVELMGATPTIYARSRDRRRAYTSNRAPLLQTPELFKNAQAILLVEGVHNALQRQASRETVIANPRGQPLTPNEVLTLLAPYIISYPSTNIVLPFTPFPPLTVIHPEFGPFKQNAPIALFIPRNSTLAETFFVTFLSGTNTKAQFPFDINRKTNTFKADVGRNMAGQTYVFVSNSSSNRTFSESDILFGPAVIEVAPLPRNISAFDNLETRN
jgi:hypothetical protein